ncbi:hypothetical protein PQX77_002921 [Marasmius sp. AFHP31]|nr:hypothetical protein PQX77_002921 [Marasmius sp. AFHP31]
MAAEVESFLASISSTSIAASLSASEGLLNSDPHIAKIDVIRLRHSTNKSDLDLLLHRAHNAPLPDNPLHSVWRDITLDKFIHFDKLHAAIQPGYNHSDEPKLEVGDMVISEKGGVSSRKPISNEIEWNRVYAAWSSAVIFVFPHCRDELLGYHRLMARFFRDHHSSNPLVAVRLDARIREAYS